MHVILLVCQIEHTIPTVVSLYLGCMLALAVHHFMHPLLLCINFVESWLATQSAHVIMLKQNMYQKTIMPVTDCLSHGCSYIDTRVYSVLAAVGSVEGLHVALTSCTWLGEGGGAGTTLT